MRDIKDPEVRRSEIMDASLLLFMEKGYLKTTTQNIIDKVGISRGLLYYHFKNKEDILYCLVERYSEPLLRKLKSISYDTSLSAIEKIRLFMTVTLIAPTTITDEMEELQKTVDLEQNRYIMDKFSHKFVDKVTIYFSDIIIQGNREKHFFVEHPFETSAFLMNAYVFTSNSMSHNEGGEAYLEAFKLLLRRSLNTKENLFID